MPDRMLSQLTELAVQPAIDDEIYIRDVSEVAASESKRITVANLLAPIIASNDGTKTTLLTTAGDYWRIGDAATTQFGLNSEDDLFVTGELEATTAFFGAVNWNVKIEGDKAGIYFGDRTNSWDLLLKWTSADYLRIRNAADTTDKNLQCALVLGTFVEASSGFVAGADAIYLGARDINTGYMTGKARDTGVGLVEVNRWQGAADPYFQIGRNDVNVGDAAVTDNLLILGGRGAQASANGTGVGIAFYLGNDQATPENEKRTAINAVLADNTNGAEIAGFELYGMTGGALNLAATLSGAGGLGVDADIGTADDPVALFDGLDDAIVLKQGIQQRNYDSLVEMGVFTKKETGSGYMMNIQPMTRLLAGGIYQNRQLLEDTKETLIRRLESVEKKLELLTN